MFQVFGYIAKEIILHLSPVTRKSISLTIYTALNNGGFGKIKDTAQSLYISNCCWNTELFSTHINK